MKLEIRKLMPEDAEAYVHFFDTTPHDDGNPENTCYCVSWCREDHRAMSVYPSREGRRQMALNYVKTGALQGYLAYADGQLVGWCNANAKAACRNCGGWLFTLPQVAQLPLGPAEKVKSIHCFLVAPEWKRKGIARALLAYACRDAAEDGFDAVEAYPRKGTEEERMFFLGFEEMYQEAGFQVVAETEGHYVMRKNLS